MLCYVTPKEHLGLPNRDDLKAGIIAYKIADVFRTSVQKSFIPFQFSCAVGMIWFGGRRNPYAPVSRSSTVYAAQMFSW